MIAGYGFTKRECTTILCRLQKMPFLTCRNTTPTEILVLVVGFVFLVAWLWFIMFVKEKFAKNGSGGCGKRTAWSLASFSHLRLGRQGQIQGSCCWNPSDGVLLAYLVWFMRFWLKLEEITLEEATQGTLGPRGVPWAWRLALEAAHVAPLSACCKTCAALRQGSAETSRTEDEAEC